jgi:hypothetical protein
MAYDYEGRVDYRGDRVRAMELVRHQLATKGLVVMPLSVNQLGFENPGSYLTMKKPSLLMLSKGVITATESTFEMKAELDTRKMLTWVFVRAMAWVTVAQVLMLAVLFAMGANPLYALQAFPEALLFLIVFGRRVSNSWKANTARTLDALLNDMANEAGKRV